jgi:SAM-dependent methyltransferase
MPHADDYCPLDDDTAAMQLEALIERAGSLSGCILDLGCGDGRTAIPLARAGHTVLAVDHDHHALDALREKLSDEDEPTRARLHLLEANIATLNPDELLAHTAGPISAAICLGHTFMLLHDPLDALHMLRTLRSVLPETGWVAIDDFPHDLWYEVSEGNWQAGLAEVEPEDGGPPEVWQMVWKPGDPVIALRRNEEVDADQIEILPTDRLHRLYSLGELRLLSACSGFREPLRSPEEAMILLEIEPASTR